MQSQVILTRGPNTWPPVVVQLRIHVNVEVVVMGELLFKSAQTAERRSFRPTKS